MRLLFFSLEFADPVFSGNGVYCRSLVAATARMLAKSHESITQIDVVCGVPHDLESAFPQAAQPSPLASNDAEVASVPVLIHAVPVPVAKWRRLDRLCPWQEFAAGCSSASLFGSEDLQYACVYVVDWSGWVAFQSAVDTVTALRDAPMVYLNFRVFAAPGATELRALLHATPDADCGGDAVWYARRESDAMRHSRLTIALCRADVDTLLSHDAALAQFDGRDAVPSDKMRVLSPPLRADVLKLATAHHGVATPQIGSSESDVALWSLLSRVAAAEDVAAVQRAASNATVVFITCLVRLDPVKEAHRFPSLAQRLLDALSQMPQSASLLVVPFLAGAAGDMGYATSVKTELRKRCPLSLIATAFLDANDFALLFPRTLVNVHPCVYDAYGMTIVEAAAFGVPSLVHHRDGATAVGAAVELLPADRNGVWAVDLLDEGTLALDVTSRIMESRLDEGPRFNASESEFRRTRALGYTEDIAATRLLRETL